MGRSLRRLTISFVVGSRRLQSVSGQAFRHRILPNTFNFLFGVFVEALFRLATFQHAFNFKHASFAARGGYNTLNLVLNWGFTRSHDRLFCNFAEVECVSGGASRDTGLSLGLCVVQTVMGYFHLCLGPQSIVEHEALLLIYVILKSLLHRVEAINLKGHVADVTSHPIFVPRLLVLAVGAVLPDALLMLLDRVRNRAQRLLLRIFEFPVASLHLHQLVEVVFAEPK